MFCEKCGNMLPEGSKFCLNCGAKAEAGESVQNAAVQEAAVSADAPVIEAEPAAVEKEIAEIPEVQPVSAQNFKIPTAAQNIQNPAAPQNIQQKVPPQDLRQPASSSQPIASAMSAGTDMKPEKIKPLQTWKFIGMFIITAIPVINLIMVLVWSFSGGFNKNTRSYARATLILWIIGLVLLIITAIVNWALIQYIWSSLTSVPVEFTPMN